MATSAMPLPTAGEMNGVTRPCAGDWKRRNLPPRTRRRWCAAWMISAAANASLCFLMAIIGVQSVGQRGMQRVLLTSSAHPAEPQELIVLAPQRNIDSVPAPQRLSWKSELSATLPIANSSDNNESAIAAPSLDSLAAGAPLESGHFERALAQLSALGADAFESSEAQDSGQGAEFYGVKASGRKFVFVVDSSRSMLGARWQAAVRELLAAISKLGEDQRFYVVFFDAHARPMFDLPPSEARFAAADDANIERLRRWAGGLVLGPDTEPLAAMKIACQLKPDAIYLLSDGEFRDKTALYLRLHNRAKSDGAARDSKKRRGETPGHAFSVHTIALESRDGQPLLERIAAENAGQFRFIE